MWFHSREVLAKTIILTLLPGLMFKCRISDKVMTKIVAMLTNKMHTDIAPFVSVIFSKNR